MALLAKGANQRQSFRAPRISASVQSSDNAGCVAISEVWVDQAACCEVGTQKGSPESIRPTHS